ncbi:carbohydrate sulfotransferase 14 isoform X2 [Anoplolepis gracilipes]|uniref:carbohydrate sulfotransferase 14 isoform X2 n=1 Tax=Anoplolepis gracilipes TaxID=354296 RepID=UPI003BA3A822
MTQRLTINHALTSNGNENLTIYARLLKTNSYHLAKRLFSLIQKQITVIKLILLLTSTCIVVILLILMNLTRTSYTKTNIESTASPRYATPKYASEIIIPLVTMSENQMEDVKRELDNRRQRMARVCEAIDAKESHLDTALTNMIIDTEHKLSWCPIYKAASSTWMIYFAALKGALTDVTMDSIRRNLVQVNDIVRQKFQHDADFNKTHEEISKTKRFLIVRHPLERLLSAYRDKLEHIQGREYYYRRFGRRIALKYRQPGDNVTRLEPTFAEFLRFIVNEKYFDEHWAPYYRTCEPCALHYDYILKVETLDRDQNFLIQDAKLSDYLYDVRHPGNINPHGATTRKMLDEYITEIPRSLLDQIYKIYENDYKLFNYSFI